MPDIIHLLSENVANQIAAGEVIQRPASAVKELLENAIDSGATNIKLIIKDAGKQLIQVIDNGCGMSNTDARMAFERHATSKIKSVEDLFAIRTMGFRGEALASIAAVAQVEIKTRRVEDELGTELIVEATEVKHHDFCQAPLGTSISVKNLFFNIPARRAFLKSNPVETKHIIDEFQRIALSHPDKDFGFYQNDVEVYRLKPGNLRQRIVSIFGNGYNEKLVPVEEKTNIMEVRGFIGKPEFAKKTRGEQFFFINQRFIRNSYLNHAVMTGYHNILPKDSYPLFALFIDIDPSRIDINVHPQKHEVKFDEERIVYTFVHAAVRHALAQYSVTPTLDFSQDPTFIQMMDTVNVSSMENVVARIQNRDYQYQNTEMEIQIEQPELGSDDLPRRNETEIAQPIGDPLKWTSKFDIHHSDLPTPFQIHNRFIVTQIKSGFILVDQQSAHERILFEEFLDAMNNNRPMSQQQLFPQTIKLQPADAALLSEILPEVNKLGFEIQEFGRHTFVIHGLPGDFQKGVDEQKLIESLIEQFKLSNRHDLKLSKRENLAKFMATQSSVKSGRALSKDEMKMLIDKLFTCKTPYASPTGRRTFVKFDFHDIEKKFTSE